MTQVRRESFFKFLESLGESAWQLNLGTHELRTSETFWRALGYAPNVVLATRDAAVEFVHPADLELAVEEVNLHLAADEPFELELRVSAANGEWHFIRVRGSANEWNAKLEPSCIGGILEDITDKLVAARSRSNASALIETLSVRERQVLSCLVAGAASKNIAYGLGISQRTVEGYRGRIMEKLGVRGVGDLVQLALAGGVTANDPVACGQAPPS